MAALRRRAVVEDLLRKHLHEMSKEDLQALLARLEKKYSAQYGKKVTVAANAAHARRRASATGSTSRAASAAAAASTPA